MSHPKILPFALFKIDNPQDYFEFQYNPTEVNVSHESVWDRKEVPTIRTETMTFSHRKPLVFSFELFMNDWGDISHLNRTRQNRLRVEDQIDWLNTAMYPEFSDITRVNYSNPPILIFFWKGEYWPVVLTKMDVTRTHFSPIQEGTNIPSGNINDGGIKKIGNSSGGASSIGGGKESLRRERESFGGGKTSASGRPPVVRGSSNLNNTVNFATLNRNERINLIRTYLNVAATSEILKGADQVAFENIQKPLFAGEARYIRSRGQTNPGDAIRATAKIELVEYRPSTVQQTAGDGKHTNQVKEMLSNLGIGANKVAAQGASTTHVQSIGK